MASVWFQQDGYISCSFCGSEKKIQFFGNRDTDADICEDCLRQAYGSLTSRTVGEQFYSGKYYAGTYTTPTYTYTYGPFSQGIVDHLTNPKSMRTLNSMMKRLLDADTKTLLKAGFMNGDLLLTEDGRLALTTLLFEDKKKELVKMAEEKIAEDKEDCD